MKINSLLKVSVLALSLGLTNHAMAQANAEDQLPEMTSEQDRQADRDERSRDGNKMHRKGKRPYHAYEMKDSERAFQEDMALFVPGYGPVSQEVVDTLNLTDDQKDKIEDIKKKAKEQMEEYRESENKPFQKMSEKRSEQLAEKKLDPKAILKEQDSIKKEMDKHRDKFNKDWLAVWNDLDDDQQAKVAAYFDEKESRRAEHMEKRKEMREKRKSE